MTLPRSGAKWGARRIDCLRRFIPSLRVGGDRHCHLRLLDDGYVEKMRHPETDRGRQAGRQRVHYLMDVDRSGLRLHTGDAGLMTIRKAAPKRTWRLPGGTGTEPISY
jgi:hypothetical protein